MSRFGKLALVLGGYVAACLVAGAIVYVWQLLTQDVSAQASGGMYAGGDFILFAFTFAVLAFFPTALAFYFLIKKFMARQ